MVQNESKCKERNPLIADTETLVRALRILARDIESGDGVANETIREAADMIETQHNTLCTIAVWAACDPMSKETREKAMEDIYIKASAG